MTTEQIMWTALITLIVLALVFMWAALRASSTSGAKQDEINRLEYQKRLDTKGGNK